MLRYLGIPARVAAGFTSGAYDVDRGTWRVNDRNAHAWVEVWFPGYGWLPFDPTPGRGNARRRRTRRRRPSVDAGDGARGARARRARASPRPARARRILAHAAQRPRPDRLRGGDGGGDLERRRRYRAVVRAAALARPRSLSLVLLAAFAACSCAKAVRRRARYLTRDPRAVAAAVRGASSWATWPTSASTFRASATLAELGGDADGSGVDATPFARATRPRRGPLRPAVRRQPTRAARIARAGASRRPRSDPAPSSASAARRLRGSISLRSLRSRARGLLSVRDRSGQLVAGAVS